MGNIETVDIGDMAIEVTDLIQRNVNDRSLRRWIMPDFSTTTDSDDVVAAVIMMGTLQKCFNYKMTMMCGIPTVTLLGERSDWESLLSKIEKLDGFGIEPPLWASRLRPVLKAFVACFDTPNASSVREFWNKCPSPSADY